MGQHRVYSARARGAVAPRAGHQRQQMRGGGAETICQGLSNSRLLYPILLLHDYDHIQEHGQAQGRQSGV